MQLKRIMILLNNITIIKPNRIMKEMYVYDKQRFNTGG